MKLNNGKIRGIVAARQFLYRFGIKTIIGVIGVDAELIEATSYKEIQLITQKERCDFIIVSEELLVMPKCCSLEALQGDYPNTKLLVIRDKAVENCPYSSFVVNTDNQKEILDKLQDFFFEPEIKETPDDIEKLLLSGREIEVLKSVALGFSNKEIADKLFISINTVITHRKNITEKLGIKTIAGLTVYAMMNNYIKPGDAIQ